MNDEQISNYQQAKDQQTVINNLITDLGVMDEGKVITIVNLAVNSDIMGSSNDVLRDLEEDQSPHINIFHAYRPTIEALADVHEELLAYLLVEYENTRSAFLGLRRREELLKDIRSQVPTEYIEEAEENDGYTYWMIFIDSQAVLTDVALWKELGETHFS